MAFINKIDPVVINIKLTTKGRELLSTGTLGFKYFAVGDSEINYDFNAQTGLLATDATILRPADKNPSLLSFIPRNLSGDPYNEIPNIPTTQYVVTNTAAPIGFYTISSAGTATFITDSNHVKQPDVMIDVTGVNGGNQLTLIKAPTYGSSGEEPAIGDLLLVKWTINTSTTGYTINKSTPTPYLIYKIQNINSGSLATNNMVVTVDRNVPNFSGLTIGRPYAGTLVYHDYINFSGETVFTMSPTDYLDESVLAFLQNYQCPTIIFPFWNLTIIYTEEIAGVTAGKKTYGQFKNASYGGFVSYIQNQAPVHKKLGVIHYTNNSPANVYGEELFVDVPGGNVPTLNIPTIMWHKSSGATLGLQLKAIGAAKLLTSSTSGTSLNTRYYDLADNGGNIVGKVFSDLKIFVIEDQELLFAMSYKANRNWTLPDYIASTTSTVVIDCPPSAPTITWTTPTYTGLGGISSVQYCYKSAKGNVGWTNFTIGGSHSVCEPIYCAGFRVCFGSPCGGGGGIIWACDYANCCTISTTISGGLGTIVLALCGINYNSDYTFGGALS